MSQTRPSGYPLISESSAVVTEEVAEVDARGRLYLLPRWTQRVLWWPAAPADDFCVLMVFVEPGVISLRDWNRDGARIVARYSELVDSHEAGAQDALRLIQDRFQKLQLDKDRRPHLGDAGLAHLGFPIERGHKHTVYVAVFPDRLDVLSPTYRNARLLSGSPWLDDLP